MELSEMVPFLMKLTRAVNHQVPVWHHKLVCHQWKSDEMIQNYHEEVEKQNQQAVKNGKDNIDNCWDFGKDNSHSIENEETNSFCRKQGRGNADTGIACS